MSTEMHRLLHESVRDINPRGQRCINKTHSSNQARSLLNRSSSVDGGVSSNSDAVMRFQLDQQQRVNPAPAVPLNRSTSSGQIHNSTLSFRDAPPLSWHAARNPSVPDLRESSVVTAFPRAWPEPDDFKDGKPKRHPLTSRNKNLIRPRPLKLDDSGDLADILEPSSFNRSSSLKLSKSLSSTVNWGDVALSSFQMSLDDDQKEDKSVQTDSVVTLCHHGISKSKDPDPLDKSTQTGSDLTICATDFLEVKNLEPEPAKFRTLAPQFSPRSNIPTFYLTPPDPYNPPSGGLFNFVGIPKNFQNLMNQSANNFSPSRFNQAAEDNSKNLLSSENSNPYLFGK